tara:strand:- start:1110 stop:1304 length:195 start_codon:yes stop_codon:yes gene_type:complete
MDKRVVYEVFNPRTGKWEKGVTTDEEIDKAFEVYLKDFEYYEAEKKIIEKIILQHIQKKEISDV